jgi:hypothetical protein
MWFASASDSTLSTIRFSGAFHLAGIRSYGGGGVVCGVLINGWPDTLKDAPPATPFAAPKCIQRDSGPRVLRRRRASEMCSEIAPLA